MTKDETLAIMSVLKAAYPSYYRGMERKDAESVVALWVSMFAEDSAAVVTAAVKALLATDANGYPPHIGAVKEKIRLLTGPKSMTELEAWAMVSKAIKNSGYESRKEFDKLPDAVKHAVHSPDQLREWSQMDPDTIQSVIASNFMRSYRAKAKSEQDIAALPSDVRRMIGTAASTIALE